MMTTKAKGPTPSMAPPRRRLPCINLLLAITIATALSSNNIQQFGATAFAFTPSRLPAPLASSTANNAIILGRRHVSTKLYNLLDAMGEMLAGPKLEPETNLPYDPPFCSELSCSDGLRTFAIKERPISFTGEDFDVVDITSGSEEAFGRVR